MNVVRAATLERNTTCIDKGRDCKCYNARFISEMSMWEDTNRSSDTTSFGKQSETAKKKCNHCASWRHRTEDHHYKQTATTRETKEMGKVLGFQWPLEIGKYVSS